MKYIDAELLKAKLDEHYRKYQSKYMETRNPYTQGLIDALDLAEQIIDSLQQEQQEVDLEEEMRKELRLHYNDDQDVYWWNYLKNSFRHFYELGLNARKEE